MFLPAQKSPKTLTPLNGLLLWRQLGSHSRPQTAELLQQLAAIKKQTLSVAPSTLPLPLPSFGLPNYTEAWEQKPLKQFNRTRKSKEQRKKSAQISKDEMKCKSFYFDAGAAWLDCKSLSSIPSGSLSPGRRVPGHARHVGVGISFSLFPFPPLCPVAGSAISVYKLIFTLGHDWHPLCLSASFPCPPPERFGNFLGTFV